MNCLTASFFHFLSLKQLPILLEILIDYFKVGYLSFFLNRFYN